MFDSENLERRDFVKVVLAFLGSIMAAVIGLPVVGYLISPAIKKYSSDSWISVGKLEAYQIGVPTLFNFSRTKVNGWERTVSSYGVYVVKTTADQAYVCSNMCSHLGCHVSWKPEVQEYVCPCHDAHFNSQGKVLAGPPPAPLQTYETKIEDEVLFIHFVEG
jgi:Rieske Fe-S protein